MNDFVAKPVDPENLFSMIIKWLPEHMVSMALTPASAPLEEEDTALYAQLAAIDGMDAETGLRNLRGDVAAYLRLLRRLDAAHGEDMEKLSKHLVDGEIDEARRLAHTLKGAASALGLTRLQEAAGVLEENLGKAGGEGATHLMAAVSSEQNNLHEALARIAAPAVTEQKVKADPAKARQVLDRLGALLAADDTAANALFLESEALLKSTFGPAAGRVGQQIEAFDYPAALKILDSMRSEE